MKGPPVWTTVRCRENLLLRLFSRLGPVPRMAASLLILLLGVIAAITLTSCGEEDAQLLPGETAREITANLDTVKQLADEGDCIGAESATLQVSEQVDALAGVDERLQRALREGAARLNEVVAGCEEETEAIVPNVPAPETEPATTDEEEKDKQKEKDEEREKESGEKPEEEPAEEEAEPPLPPQAKGEGKGLENENGANGGEEGGGSPSGGVSPGSPAGEGE